MDKKKFWRVYFSLLAGFTVAEAVTPLLTGESFSWTHFAVFEVVMAIVLFLALRFENKNNIKTN